MKWLLFQEKKFFCIKERVSSAHVHFAVSTFQVPQRGEGREAQRFPIKGRNRRDTVARSNLFAVILKLTNSTYFPAVLVKFVRARNRLVTFCVKSRENDRARKHDQRANNGQHALLWQKNRVCTCLRFEKRDNLTARRDKRCLRNEMLDHDSRFRKNAKAKNATCNHQSCITQNICTMCDLSFINFITRVYAVVRNKSETRKSKNRQALYILL